MPWEEIILRRQWSTVSKQDTGFYEKEVVREYAGYSVYSPFLPFSVPLRAEPCRFYHGPLALWLPSGLGHWEAMADQKSEEEGKIFPPFLLCFGVWS